MNTIVTSREQILSSALEMARESGLTALDMRGLAARCGVAVGSLYNYFPSKSALMAAVVGEIWRGILPPAPDQPRGDFIGALERLYEGALRGSDEYPALFTAHARMFTGSGRDTGRQAMNDMIGEIRRVLERELSADERVRADAFGDDLTREQFVAFVMDSLTAMLRCDCASCPTLLKVVRRMLY